MGTQWCSKAKTLQRLEAALESDGGDFLVVQVALIGTLEMIKEAVTFQGSLLGELKFEILQFLFCDEKFSILFSRVLP